MRQIKSSLGADSLTAGKDQESLLSSVTQKKCDVGMWPLERELIQGSISVRRPGPVGTASSLS